MKKLLCAILSVILLLMLTACGGEGEASDATGGNVENVNSVQDDTIEMLIREGNALYQKGEEEAAKLAFDRAVKLMNEKCNSPEEFLSSVNLDEKLSDTAKEMFSAYYLIDNDGTGEKPSLPEEYDWGDK